MCFWTKRKQQNKKSNIKTLAGAGDWTRDILHPPSQLSVSIVVKPLNKQSQICGPDIFNKYIFL